MKNKLSLLKYCKSCKFRCCKAVGGIGSPILTNEEADKCEERLKGSTKEVISSNKEKYYLLRIKEGTNHCIFLDDKGKCMLQNIKPLDCLCYPIKAISKGEKIVFLVDNECPALEHLSREFIEKAKKVALDSIKRFDKKTFQHWLDNYIGWIKNAKEI